jgi:hypothetical protein
MCGGSAAGIFAAPYHQRGNVTCEHLQELATNSETPSIGRFVLIVP